MTQDEYKAAIRKARKDRPKATKEAMDKVRSVYQRVLDDVGAVLAGGSLDGGSLDPETDRKVNDILVQGQADIDQAIKAHIPELVASSGAVLAGVESAFVADAIKEGVTKITPRGVAKVFEAVTTDTVQRTLSQVGKDGFSFWGRANNTSKLFSDEVVAFTRAGIAQGRDLGKLAVDITRLMKDGKAGTVKRWGEVLKPESKELLKRCPEAVDYRALRLARSELGRGLMETAKANGQANPGASGWYDWVRTGSIDWGCSCPSNAANSPYLLENFPAYDHPNCACFCRAVMKNGNDFRAELDAWANGEPNEALDKWYAEKYQPNQV